ncbi:MAG: hypothetical protein LBC37_00940 [Zoogloeaceae bacterium]|nr:hypothetical protein [Zoogloeaceae bacterium]
MLALNGNQGTLRKEVRALLEAPAQKEAAGDVKIEKGHGRIDPAGIGHEWVTERVAWIDPQSTFPGLKTLAMVESERETTGGRILPANSASRTSACAWRRTQNIGMPSFSAPRKHAEQYGAIALQRGFSFCCLCFTA